MTGGRGAARVAPDETGGQRPDHRQKATPVSRQESWQATRRRWMNALHARAAGLGRPATAFESHPEPRTIGSVARGRNLVAGRFHFAGYLVEAPGTGLWDVPTPDRAFTLDLHGFTWLDDLAALGDLDAALRARDWTHEWVRRFGAGGGPGWTPDLTGRRLIRCINHAILLLNGREKAESEAFFRALARQTIFLSRRWRAASHGLPRFEALTGLIYAGLALTGTDRHVGPALKALNRECEREIDGTGALSTRNPEELLEVFTLLTWAAQALGDAGRMPGPAHLNAIAKVAPVLRGLRHADGALARFHGGGRGLEGRLVAALAASGVRGVPRGGLCMGYARLSQGRTTVIVDAAPPPEPEASANAHASTLAFELTSGRRPVIVNCGSGQTFGASWRRAGRATPSHSTLGIEGYSSSRLGVTGMISGHRAELLVDAPTEVRAQIRQSETGGRLIASHNGYAPTHGLHHARTLELSADGRALSGVDVLSPRSEAAERQFQLSFDHGTYEGLPFSVRFHLHPDVQARLVQDGEGVAMRLRSGEVWLFRYQGPARLTLEASVYLEKSRLGPRATKQIVLSASAIEHTTRIGWRVAKTRETPSYIRDTETGDITAIH